MYALIDCNNFYCACERLFNPALIGKPVVVLSNNDGSVISRSEEAKKLGIAMGTPAFLIHRQLQEKQVKVFSSNYTLYGDMSDRVMKTVAGFVQEMEIYSIDEAFADLGRLSGLNLSRLGGEIRKKVERDTGIGVSIGIAPTKTLAKMANRQAKKNKGSGGVFLAAEQLTIDQMLRDTEVGDIWGIGHQYALLLNRYKLHTAAALLPIPAEWIREKMGVVGLRLVNELKGIPSLKWEKETIVKKNICTSRSFGKPLSEKPAIAEALVNYAANCALQLRKQQTCCRKIQVFISTNPNKMQDRQYQRSITVKLEKALNDSPEIIKYALKGLDLIYQHGYQFMKVGILVMDFVPEQSIQQGVFDQQARLKNKKMMETMDLINKNIGKEKLRFAVQGFDKKYRLRADRLSPCYTTRIDQIPKVKI